MNKLNSGLSHLQLGVSSGVTFRRRGSTYIALWLPMSMEYPQVTSRTPRGKKEKGASTRGGTGLVRLLFLDGLPPREFSFRWPSGRKLSVLSGIVIQMSPRRI